MALAGTLQDFSLPDIFQLIGVQRKTGILTLTRDEETVTILFQDGMIVWAAPADEPFEEAIGLALVQRKLLTPERFQEARQLQWRRGGRLIPFLLDGEWISAADLQRVVERQVLQTLFTVFQWRDGSYSFVPQERLEVGQCPINPIGTEALLLEAMRQMDEWPIVAQRLPSFDLVLQRTAREMDPERLTPLEREILEWVDGHRTAKEIADCSGVGDFEIYKGIADLIAEGVLEVERGGEAASTVSLRPSRGRPSWVFPAALGTITILSLFVQLLLARDPLFLFADHKMMGREQLRERQGTFQVGEISRALDLYLLAMGRYPDRLEELQTRGFLSGEIRDPWGNPWAYRHGQWTYRLVSAGPDGQFGTSDDRDFSPRPPD
jgi:hypothetical protein